MHLPATYQTVVDRFVAVCRQDPRVVAALLSGSYARGAADAYSDLDLDLITTDEDYEDFVAGRAAFLRQLGEPLFLENFDLPSVVFFIFQDGTEGELAIGRESDVRRLHAGPYRVLLDKKGILTGAPFPCPEVAPADRRETLRRLVHWFWHDVSHFITAMARGQLWWAHGQLEDLRRYCVNLLWLRQSFSLRPEAYEKVDQVVPAEHLAPLRATYCPQEYGPMLQAGRIILRFFQELAPALAQTHGIRYPAELERLMIERLDKLGTRVPVEP